MVSQNLRFRFTLVSYNILSQALLNDHHYLYSACNPSDLEWPRRGHNIIKELLNNQADIICLQEVESEHLKSLYRPKLAHYGYECLYKKKTGYKVDGCAIFFKSKLFHLLGHKGIEFNRTDVAHLLDRDNVGLIAILKPRIETKSESSHLIIANTHLIFNPRRGDIKLAQLKFFLSELESFSLQSCPPSSGNPATAPTDAASQHKTKASSQPRHQHPTILCGDLNSTPDSEVSRYILKNAPRTRLLRPTTRSVTEGLVVVKEDEDITDEKDKMRHRVGDEETENGNTVTARKSGGLVGDDSERLVESMEDHHMSDYDHSLKFKSVFPTHNRTGQKYVSTFSSEIVDYIFYTPKLRLESYKELLTKEQLNEVGPIPNADFPSDHITLGAKFVLK